MDQSSADKAENVAESLSSVTAMYHRAIDGDSVAEGALWEAYAKRLKGLARAVLRQRGITPAQVSEDSVANTSLAKFFRAISEGKYQEVADRHELWCLLAVITRNHALNRAKQAGKIGQVDADPESLLRDRAGPEPTPEEVHALGEMIQSIEQQIRKRSLDPAQAERVIRVLNMTLSGHTQREIAEAIQQSEVTVRRNLKMIRELLDRVR